MQILPQFDPGADLGSALGGGMAKGYKSASDTASISTALQGLGEGASVEDKMTTIMQLNIDPDTKKNVLSHLGQTAALQEKREARANALPPGGLSGQPVPFEVTSAMSEIVKSNPEASSDEIALKFDEVGIPRTYSNSYVENRRKQEDRETVASQKKFEGDRSYHSKRAMPFLTKMDEGRDSLLVKDQALGMMRNSIQDRDLEFMSLDNLANELGSWGKGLRSVKGNQLINATKEFLLGNMARAGARPNIYIEKQIAAMLPQSGTSMEAGMGVVESLQSEQDVAKKRVEITDDLVEKYESELGYVPGNIAAQVDKQLKPYAQESQNKLAYKLRTLQESEMGAAGVEKNINKKVHAGTPLTLETAQLLFQKEGSAEKGIKRAKALGYTIPSAEEYRNYL